MTGRERFQTALRCGRPDRVPVFEQLYNQDLYVRLLGHRPDEFSNADAIRLASALGIDATVCVYDGYPGFAPPRAGRIWQSEWGVTYELDGHGWPTGYAKLFAIHCLEGVRTFRSPKLDGRERFRGLRDAAHLAHDLGIAAVAGFRGPFAMVAWHFLGTEAAMMAVADDAALIEAAVNRYMEFALPALDALADAGIDAVFLTEDLGSSHGPLISPEQHRRFFLAPLRQIVSRLRDRGLPAILHSDGDIRAFLPDLVDAGIAALHPLEQGAGMSLPDLKTAYAGRLALVGNVDTKSVLSRGLPEDVQRAVRQCIREGAPGGGYVLSSDHSFSNGFPFENMLAMIEAARQYGRYPADPEVIQEATT